ncbi:hypothetical protein BJY24_000286 [Nocardia transvalensis]|uniref:Uncharacterized protein n=1 Tax=Nocardia transvalensis TaxID=37333 RepID=A0A7W9UFP5_9NOCA|nr:hypothetical protein [Nocardia transvalensis]MBB5911419.1 hypothetical protein [Nocardia transvalensis]
MILAAVHDTLLAQIGNPAPETPPAADKLMKLVRYFTWFVILSGVLGITYAGGRFAWEKSIGAGPSPKMVIGAMIGGIIATSAGTIMNAAIGT